METSKTILENWGKNFNLFILYFHDTIIDSEISVY